VDDYTRGTHCSIHREQAGVICRGLPWPPVRRPESIHDLQALELYSLIL
jgi:hypothetical protein